MSGGRITVLPTAQEVAAAAARRVVDAGRAAIGERGAFRLALSGGSTPKLVYPLLASEPLVSALDWSRVDFFWGDERCVPPGDPRSNFGVAEEMLLSRLPGVERSRVHRMPADAEDLEEAAASYADLLRRVFRPQPGSPPSFDLIWLGMGPDGHTASLFPGSEALWRDDTWVAANWSPSQEEWRMTLTFPVLDAARAVLFVVTGADKAAALSSVRSGDEGLPAARVHAARTDWLVDAAAAAHAAESSPAP